MKPYIVAHMMSSLDGRSLTDGWHLDFASDLYEDTAATFEADGWICGRVTMQEISHGDDYPKGLAKGTVPRTDHIVERNAAQYAISIDPQGRVAWKSNTALKSHVVEVLTSQVSDDYLAYLQSIGVSYVFGGEHELDLGKVVQTLAHELGVKKLIVEGGSHVSGAFVNAGLVDEVSVLILPLVDGRSEHPSSFEVAMDKWQAPAYLTLTSVEKTQHDAVWLRYTKSVKV
ncbi:MULTISPECIES: dihydrofolate reductase family protein [Paraburkholderia]|uniref:Riboflavin biosynthesis pyrimidine reductase n=2 Tax=Paraburkholderia TaxID=1822464 RepID=A0A7Y9WRX1_9BURK|nr:dihydrofolate reductase family protein [Paraburkholderia bryophila]ASL47244.1 2,5-diamino-6-ribosylamino-4(3H)-pyrimidinone 5'-phosphate reductase [Burkholderia sp. AD24]NYH15963.1 riboflavin biosynthesis pyrimidine reductase [Paraburkholderia bryophila]NYH25607.1 riboflavin biosynthesis pyrimidine reductase [Paraburkholderia bryophila]WCM23982.1 dihydrofolate reductase family protein [Paraburkholderia bryophila]